MLKDTQVDPQLAIESTLPVLTLDFEGLKAWATGLTERYHGLVVTEDAIADVKRDMANLNKTKKVLDDARKEAVRRVSEPIRAFEAQVKEVEGIFGTAYAALGAQVKAFEDAQREEKRTAVLAIIEEELETALLNPCQLAIPVQDKWLNKTTSFKTIREDVQAIIQRHLEEEQRRQDLEQARQDRAATVESHVKSMNERHGLPLPIARFISIAMDMQQPLEQVMRRIDGEFARAVERREAEKIAAPVAPVTPTAPAASPSLPTPPTAAAPAPQPPATGTTRTMSIVLEFDIVNEAQVQACLDTLRGLCINFGARQR